MSTAFIKFLTEKDDQGHLSVNAEYIPPDETDGIIDRWGKQAMLYVHQASEVFDKLNIDSSLWMIDKGCKIQIEDHAEYLEECFDDDEDEDIGYMTSITHEDRMRIKASIKYNDINVIGSLATPSAQFAGIVAEAIAHKIGQVAV
jgi:hypothetical protein